MALGARSADIALDELAVAGARRQRRGREGFAFAGRHEAERETAHRVEPADGDAGGPGALQAARERGKDVAEARDQKRRPRHDVGVRADEDRRDAGTRPAGDHELDDVREIVAVGLAEDEVELYPR